MSTGQAPRNPTHPEALTVDDIRKGVEFYAYENGRAVGGGTFNGEVGEGLAGYINDEGHLTACPLADFGIAPYANGTWSTDYCLRR